MRPAPGVIAGGIGCVVLIMIPFVAVGVFTSAQALRAAWAGAWTDALLQGIFGLAFGVVGGAGIAGALKARRAAAAASVVQAGHPDSPWMWRADWAAGRIEDGNRSTMMAAWIFAAFWNLVSLPSAFFGLRQGVREGSPAALLILIFPAVGLGLVVWAIRATLRYRRHGVSRLALATLPASLGRSLQGTVQAPGSLDARDGVLAALTCVRRVTTGAGRNRSTSERVLWQEERRVPVRQTRTAEGMATVIPIEFALPADGEPCDSSNPRDQIVWRLALSAEVPGVDYHSTFEVPVFRTGETPDQARSEEARGDGEPSAGYVQPPSSRVRVTRSRRGTEIEFPPARNPGASAGLTLFLLLWFGAVWATWYFGAPLVFQLLFLAFGLLLLWGTLTSWLGVSRVAVDRGSVSVARGWLTTGRPRRFEAGEIADVTTRIGMQAGGTVYYDLVLVRRDGKRIAACRAVRDKREAEWLAATIREALRG